MRGATFIVIEWCDFPMIRSFVDIVLPEKEVNLDLINVRGDCGKKVLVTNYFRKKYVHDKIFYIKH